MACFARSCWAWAGAISAVTFAAGSIPRAASRVCLAAVPLVVFFSRMRLYMRRWTVISKKAASMLSLLSQGELPGMAGQKRTLGLPGRPLTFPRPWENEEDMTLLFDDTKKLEKAIGEEATRAVLNIVESAKGEAVIGAATKEDLAKVEGTVRADIARVEGQIKNLAMQVKLLIVLTLIAIAMFSPNLAALIKFAK